MIDSKAKRSSVLVVAAPGRGELPFPSGTIDAAERGENCFRYYGIATGPVVVPAEVNYYATVTEPSYPVATVV